MNLNKSSEEIFIISIKIYVSNNCPIGENTMGLTVLFATCDCIFIIRSMLIVRCIMFLPSVCILRIYYCYFIVLLILFVILIFLLFPRQPLESWCLRFTDKVAVKYISELEKEYIFDKSLITFVLTIIYPYIITDENLTLFILTIVQPYTVKI